MVCLAEMAVGGCARDVTRQRVIADMSVIAPTASILDAGPGEGDASAVDWHVDVRDSTGKETRWILSYVKSNGEKWSLVQYVHADSGR